MPDRYEGIEATFEQCPWDDCPTPNECIGSGLGCIGSVPGYEDAK